MTLVLRNGRTGDGRPISLTLRDGIIADLAPPPDAAGIDLGGRLVLPGLIDAHVHLDKTFLGLDWMPHIDGATVAARVDAEKRLRRTSGWNVADQGDALLQRLCAAGTTTLRTHVDIDEMVGLDNLHAVVALRERWADRLTIQIVAFPQSGILHCAGMPDLLDAAVREGADVVGGLDPFGFDRDVRGHLDVVFGLAERYGAPVDIHLHDGGAIGLEELREIAARTRALGMAGNVVVSHAFALGEPESDDLALTISALAGAGVSIVTSIPGDHAFPAIARMAEVGVNLALGSDNIRDAWSPMSIVSMTERAMLAAYRSGYRRDDQLTQCLDLALSGSAQALGIPRPEITPGAPADLLAFDAPNVPAIVVDRAAPNLVVRAGAISVDRITASPARL
jgi:cytosine deaminase